jgi:hypothetical protein
MRARTLVVVAYASIAVLGLAGCTDQPQELVQTERHYQGKPDSNPWDSDPSASLYTSSKWTKGDRASWDNAINARALNQNEYVRVR